LEVWLVAQLVHPWPSLGTAGAAVAFALLFRVPVGDARFLLIFVTVLMTQLSISALNDWADRARDAAAHRYRPVAMGRIAAPLALGLAIVFALGALPGALAYGTAGILVLLGLGAGWAYDLWLKPTPLSFLPFAVAFPLLPTWVGLVAGRPLPSLAWLFCAGVPLATAIHLADSLPDLELDRAAELRTLAVQLGYQRALRATVVCLLLGSLILAATLFSAPAFAIVVVLAASLGTWALMRVAASRPQHARWIVASTALVAMLAWFAGHVRG
jgi:4-hydroxybenzoate polyprenyltransferase